MRNIAMAILVGLFFAGTAQSQVELSVSSSPASVAGYTEYQVTATATDPAKVVVGFGNLVVNGSVLQVWTSTTGKTPYAADIESFFDAIGVSQPAVEQAWLDGDTHMLVSDVVETFGGEVNETQGTPLAGHGLPWADDGDGGTIPPEVYANSHFAFDSNTTIMLGLSEHLNSLPFLQVVTSTGATLDVRVLYGPPGGDGEVEDISDFPIPEPATLTLMALGALWVVRRR